MRSRPRHNDGRTTATGIKVSTRLALGFGAVIALGLGISTFSAVDLHGLADHAEELAGNRMLKVEQFTTVLDNLNSIAVSARTIMLVKDPKIQADEKASIAARRQENTAVLAKLATTVNLPKGKELLKVIDDNRSGYNELVDKAISMSASDVAQATSILVNDVRPHQAVLFKAVSDSRAMQQKIADDLADAARETATTAVTITAAMALASSRA